MKQKMILFVLLAIPMIAWTQQKDTLIYLGEGRFFSGRGHIIKYTFPKEINSQNGATIISFLQGDSIKLYHKDTAVLAQLFPFPCKNIIRTSIYAHFDPTKIHNVRYTSNITTRSAYAYFISFLFVFIFILILLGFRKMYRVQCKWLPHIIPHCAEGDAERIIYYAFILLLSCIFLGAFVAFLDLFGGSFGRFTYLSQAWLSVIILLGMSISFSLLLRQYIIFIILFLYLLAGAIATIFIHFDNGITTFTIPSLLFGQFYVIIGVFFLLVSILWLWSVSFIYYVNKKINPIKAFFYKFYPYKLFYKNA